MKYGFFDDSRREYVITRPDTPLPWINYLGCEDYFGIISNTAGGYSFYKDARLRRLTRYRYNNVPVDTGGRYIFLRDDQSAESDPAYWSPSWQPVRSRLDEYECRHGLGYTIISSSYQGIKSQTRYFVPLGQNLEIWDLTLSNNRTQAADLSIFGSVEFCLWDAWDDATNFQRNFSIGEVEVVDNVIYHKTEYRERRDHFAFFTSSETASGFETQREAFLGAYRGWEAPLAVERGKDHRFDRARLAAGGRAAHKTHLDPGESRQIIFLLGYQGESG
jgi:Cellobiose phosphorylase